MPAVCVAICYFCLSAIVTVSELDFCVRDGNRYFLSTVMTTSSGIVSSRSLPENRTRYVFRFLSFRKAAGFFFRSSPRPISASQLHASLHFHPWSIHLVVFKGSYFSFRMGDLVLGPASCLDAFSSYPFPAWLPSSTIGMITGAPAAGPSRSSRTEDSFPQISDAHNR